MGNPYALFAGRVLGLDPMPPLGQEPDAALRGSIVHEALGRFALKHPLRLPQDLHGELLAIIAEVIGE